MGGPQLGLAGLLPQLRENGVEVLLREARFRREHLDLDELGDTTPDVLQVPGDLEIDHRVPEDPAGSCTSSTSTPANPLGWTNATVVPREPGRGCSSTSGTPSARRCSIVVATSSTR